jgi:hypothetical protein
MPEKRTETRILRQDSGMIRCVGLHSRAASRFPVVSMRAIVIRSASGAVRLADRKSPQTIRNAYRSR